MANSSPILCVVSNEDEANQFQKALVALRISNPLQYVTGAIAAMALLEKSAANTFVLVFLSLGAPDANRLAAWFEAHPHERPAGLIAMTAFGDMRPIIQAYHLGVTAFLEWPLKPEDLRNALKSNRDLCLEEQPGGLNVTRLST